MGTKLSSKQWVYFKNNFKEDISKIYPIEILVGSASFRIFYENLKKHKKNYKVDDIINEMIQWCTDSIEGYFFVTRKHTKYGLADPIIVFYFLDEQDSVYFALTWK